MSLFLIEANLKDATKDKATKIIEQAKSFFDDRGASLLESKVVGGYERLYLVFEADACGGLALDPADFGGVSDFSEPQEVRLVGTTVEEVRQKAGGDYLVEWDIPAEITLEKYLERKKASAPLYDEVDYAKFLRTYVLEDATKCLCFYNAPGEKEVRDVREHVNTPISRLYKID